jgi:hypothetical protein
MLNIIQQVVESRSHVCIFLIVAKVSSTSMMYSSVLILSPLLWLIIVNTHLGHSHNDNDKKKKMMVVVMIIVWDYLESWGLGVGRLMGLPSGQH